MDGTIITDQGDTFYNFVPLSNYNFLNRACIYTVWTALGEPGRYNILYIGQTGELGVRLDNHHKRQCWIDHTVNGLYIGFWWMPSNQYTQQNRLDAETNLIRRYNPICNG